MAAGGWQYRGRSQSTSAARQRAPCRVSRRQRYGHGQRGGSGSRPLGRRCVWPERGPALAQNPATAADPGLAGGCRAWPCSWKASRLKAEIKWPNDLAARRTQAGGVAAAACGLRSGGIRWPRWIGGQCGRTGYPREPINLGRSAGTSMPDQRGGGPSPPGMPLGPDCGGAMPANPDGVSDSKARQRLHLPPDPLRHTGKPWQAVGLNREQPPRWPSVSGGLAIGIARFDLKSVCF